MKIGTKFPECIRDLVTGDVEFERVMLVLDYGGYNFDHSDDWEACWSYYSQPMGAWYGLDKDDTWKIIDELMFHHKIHRYESRIEPAWRFPWMEMVIPNEYLDQIPQLKQLWEEYELLAKLSIPADKY